MRIDLFNQRLTMLAQLFGQGFLLLDQLLGILLLSIFKPGQLTTQLAHLATHSRQLLTELGELFPLTHQQLTLVNQMIVLTGKVLTMATLSRFQPSEAFVMAFRQIQQTLEQGAEIVGCSPHERDHPGSLYLASEQDTPIQTLRKQVLAKLRLREATDPTFSGTDTGAPVQKLGEFPI
ncbi:hypothetical protein WCLP8_2740007 [uncultured Gammaproteobacteria bacterium]